MSDDSEDSVLPLGEFPEHLPSEDIVRILWKHVQRMEGGQSEFNRTATEAFVNSVKLAAQQTDTGKSQLEFNETVQKLLATTVEKMREIWTAITPLLPPNTPDINLPRFPPGWDKPSDN